MTNPQGKKTSNAAKTKQRPEAMRTPARIMKPRALLIVCVLLLMLIGLVMIYSASSVEAMTEKGDSAFYLKKQLVYIIIGAIVCYLAARVPYRLWLSRFSWAVWAAVVLALMATAIMGIVGLGAQRWITLPVLGTFQPSEFAKIAVILVISSLVTRYEEGALDAKWFVGLIGVAAGVPALFIIFQPDLGTTIIVLVAAIMALWFGEVDFRPILAAGVFITVIGVIFILASPYRMTRVKTMLDPWADPLGDGYQIINSLYAFGSGGIFGVGLGNSYQKYSYLPEAHTDFVFSIIGEELGLIGALFVIFLFIAFIYAGIMIARNAPTLQGTIIAGASSGVIGFQAFINIACTIGLFPVTGKPLPFVSSGGSSLLATLLLVGLILSVSFNSNVADAGARRRMDFQIIDGGAPTKSNAQTRSNRSARTNGPAKTSGSRRLSANDTASRGAAPVRKTRTQGAPRAASSKERNASQAGGASYRRAELELASDRERRRSR